MLKNASFWVAAGVVYFTTGLLWAATFGINMMDVRASDGTRTYDHQFFEVISAEFDNETLWLCVAGLQMHHSSEPAEATRFAVSVPVELLWTNDEQARSDGFYRPWWGEHYVKLPLRQVFSSCQHGQDDFRTLPVERLTETTDIGDFFDGFNADELRSFLRDRPAIQEVLVIPQSFNAVDYSQQRQIAFVHSEADQFGNRFIVIDVRPQRREHKLGSGKVSKAFALDALTFPYQMYVWVSYAGAH